MTTKNETPKNDFNATIGNTVLPAVNYWKMEETFIQLKRRHRKEKKKCHKIVAKDVREIKKQGYTSNGWVDGYYGTYFRHWGKDGVNKYLEYYTPWLWRLAVV